MVRVSGDVGTTDVWGDRCRCMESHVMVRAGVRGRRRDMFRDLQEFEEGRELSIRVC